MSPEIKEYVEKYQALLPLNKSISVPEAERRAGLFLEAMASLVNWKHILTEDKIRCLSVERAVYCEELFKGDAKTMTENKTKAEASGVYTAAREDMEKIDNDISYLKANMEIFQNGHVFYRQMAKESN